MSGPSIRVSSYVVDKVAPTTSMLAAFHQQRINHKAKSSVSSTTTEVVRWRRPQTRQLHHHQQQQYEHLRTINKAFTNDISCNCFNQRKRSSSSRTRVYTKDFTRSSSTGSSTPHSSNDVILTLTSNVDDDDVKEEEEQGLPTQYTIDCPSTDPQVLKQIVLKHIKTKDQYLLHKPIAKHTSEAFDIANNYLQTFMSQNLVDGIILDSGCGTGISTILLANTHPEHLVVGIDRSINRLSKRNINNFNAEEQKQQQQQTLSIPKTQHKNAILVRAELVDFWRCCLEQEQQSRNISDKFLWKDLIKQHYILYPNPYPKLSRIKHRWYGHSSFPILMELSSKCDRLILRSNWYTYLKEFSFATQIYNNHYKNERDKLKEMEKTGTSISRTEEVLTHALLEQQFTKISSTTNHDVAMTSFEQKYFNCGESCYELVISKCSLRIKQ